MVVHTRSFGEAVGPIHKIRMDWDGHTQAMHDTKNSNKILEAVPGRPIPIHCALYTRKFWTEALASIPKIDGSEARHQSRTPRSFVETSPRLASEFRPTIILVARDFSLPPIAY